MEILSSSREKGVGDPSDKCTRRINNMSWERTNGVRSRGMKMDLAIIHQVHRLLIMLESVFVGSG